MTHHARYASESGTNSSEDSTVFGYHGRYLRVDLTTGCSAWIPLPEEILRRFLGGVGLATYLLHREAPPGIGPATARQRTLQGGFPE